MKSSYTIWINRFNRQFSPWRLNIQRSSPSGCAGGMSGPQIQGVSPAGGWKPESKQVAAVADNNLNGTRLCVEKRVLVDGKWLRDGKRSDHLPNSGPDCGVQTAKTVSCVSLPKIVPSFIEKQIPLDPIDSEYMEDGSLDAKDLIRAFTNESNEKESSIHFDSLAGVDDRIINKILASHPTSLLDSPGSEPLSKTKP